MYIKIRKLGEKDGVNDLLVSISKKASIQELRAIISEKLKVEADRQRLFYKGKLLIDDHCLIEYNVQLNDVVQLMVRSADTEEILSDRKDVNTKAEEVNEVPAQSKYYKVGDYVDMRDIHGAWFEGKIVKICKGGDNNEEDSLIFYVAQQSELERAPTNVKYQDIRPRSYKELSLMDLSKNLTVLVNYNIDNNKELGYWYDFIITEVEKDILRGTILLGSEKTPMSDIVVKFTYPIFRIETPATDYSATVDFEKIPLRRIPFNCLKCKDNPKKKCYECGCKICGGKNDWHLLLLCDECDNGYHIGCLNPPLEQVPQEDHWYCPECKTDENEIVKAGDKLKFNKKKAKMPSSSKDSTRDWGRGMACVGRTKVCTLVKKNHVGPIPGVDVGTTWCFRMQVSEAGVHRPPVGGIHGCEKECAYSIVLSGGYEDDIDNGDEFYYTGSGGRDLSGNKRVSEQACDQELTHYNKALAMNCNAKFNMNGAEAENWKEGKPVRVVRNCKAAKHSKYAPKAGNRYDGIYKVVKYYPEKGKSGFRVWKYLLRRDDPSPAPWHPDGKELEMIYPPGYEELQALKEKEKLEKKSAGKRGSKRVLAETSPNNNIEAMFKRPKTDKYELEKSTLQLIESDISNIKLWNECMDMLEFGKREFLTKVEEIFMCICCQELVHTPITTFCKHNICKNCLKRSFKSEIYTCPYCRFELGKDYKFQDNEFLDKALLKLFPGYDSSRNMSN